MTYLFGPKIYVKRSLHYLGLGFGSSNYNKGITNKIMEFVKNAFHL